MDLVRVEIIESPQRAGHARLCGDVAYDDRAASPERYWFEVPREQAEQLLRLATVGERHQRVIAHQAAQVAVQGLGGMKEK